MNVVEIILASEERADDEFELVAVTLIDLAQTGEIRNGYPQYSARLQYPLPLSQYLGDLAALEVLENVAVVDGIDRAIANERQTIYCRHMINVGIVDRIDVDKARNVPLAAA